MILTILFNDGIRTVVDGVDEFYPGPKWVLIKKDGEEHYINSDIIQEIAKGDSQTYANEGPL